MKKVKFLLTGESVTTTGKEKWINGCGQTEVVYSNGVTGWEFTSDLYDNK